MGGSRPARGTETRQVAEATRPEIGRERGYKVLGLEVSFLEDRSVETHLVGRRVSIHDPRVSEVGLAVP